MSLSVNLLLLLSALLSALTGVGASVRQPQVAQAVAQASVRSVVRVADRAVTFRPVQAPASLAMLAVWPVLRTFVPVAAHPLYASRRRE